MIEPGTYKATLISHAISETKNGDPQSAVTFSFADQNQKSHSMTWYGSFKEKSLPITLKALITCGLKGNNPAGPLEVGREVNLVIDSETDDQGKERLRIKWINHLSEVRNIIPQNLALSKLAALEGAVMLARNKSHKTESDEIPF